MTKLREIRQAKGLTQWELAKKANVYPDTVSKIERGIIGKPYQKWRQALARALEVSESELFPGCDG